MKKYITDENMGINYTLVGDVYIPNLVSTDTNYEIGYWGIKHNGDRKNHCRHFCTCCLKAVDLFTTLTYTYNVKL